MGIRLKSKYYKWKCKFSIIDVVICSTMIILTFNIITTFIMEASRGIFTYDTIINSKKYKERRLVNDSLQLISNIQGQYNILNQGNQALVDARKYNQDTMDDSYYIGYIYIDEDLKDDKGIPYYITNRGWVSDQIVGGAKADELFEELANKEGIVYYKIDNDKDFNEITKSQNFSVTPEKKKNMRGINEYYFVRGTVYDNSIVKNRMLFLAFILNLSLIIVILIKYEFLFKTKGYIEVIDEIRNSKLGEGVYYLKEVPKRIIKNLNNKVLILISGLIIVNFIVMPFWGLDIQRILIYLGSLLHLNLDMQIIHTTLSLINLGFILILVTYLIFSILRNYVFIYELLDMVREYDKGNMDAELKYKSKSEISEIVQGIKHMQEGYRQVAEERVKNERLKTELISNVSHDLKTPLTSIINYVNILGREDITKDEKNEYLKILGAKSQRLKILIDDLFEMSKLSSGKIKLNKAKVDIVQLIHMILGEYQEKLKERGLTTKVVTYNESIVMDVDPDKMVRVFDNIITNALKYSLEDTRIYIDIFDDGSWVTISFKNISSYEMNFKPERMMERFVRADSSRTSDIEGSGLGLAIVKNILEIHNGDLRLEVEGDMFKVYIMLKK
ncbi:sensor histidine kinase [Clostridium paridis]|uniref:histidine kinase n=1 Tax=Clostridium paridis TaxID=2803863 RepID=A0A937FK12_9CLOT|nr:HAMP domain-containing sensor histidine kinase [Clostridium paridis]MBL4933873.1 HAMP domain-containing histidine kinase [Clostridium paridis]